MSVPLRAAQAAAGLYAGYQLSRFALADADLSVVDRSMPEGWWKEKVVWITGASSGIGEAFAMKVAKLGARLVLSARRESELNRVKMAASGSERHLVLPMDAEDFDSHEKLVEKVLQEMGSIDVLLLNAGRGGSELATKTDFESTRKMIDLNVLHCVSLTRLVVPHMIRAQQRCCIACTSSLAGKIGVPGGTSYSMTKWALHGYFESLRFEVQDNIDICLLCPGVVKTFFGENKLVNPAAESVTAAATGGKDMTADRCAHLMAVAISNGLPEVWLSAHPELLFTYLVQYMPSTARTLLAPIAKRMLEPLQQAKCRL
jgi:dehydrogenase/reductase SDR family protein 7